MRDLNFEEYLPNVEYYNKKYKEMHKKQDIQEEDSSD